MNSFATYVEFNAYLCNTNSEQKTINQYFHLYHNIFTPNLDITFMNKFTELLEYEENLYKENNYKDDDDKKFCIYADELVTYDVITENTCGKDIKNMLTRFGLQLNVDFKILLGTNTEQDLPKHGGSNKKLIN